jgi:hypothetical protein
MNETPQHEVAERIADASRYLHPVTPRSDQHHTRRARIFTDPRCNVRCRFCYYLDNHAEAWPGWLIRRHGLKPAAAGPRPTQSAPGAASTYNAPRMPRVASRGTQSTWLASSRWGLSTTALP